MGTGVSLPGGPRLTADAPHHAAVAAWLWLPFPSRKPDAAPPQAPARSSLPPSTCDLLTMGVTPPLGLLAAQLQAKCDVPPVTTADHLLRAELVGHRRGWEARRLGEPPPYGPGTQGRHGAGGRQGCRQEGVVASVLRRTRSLHPCTRVNGHPLQTAGTECSTFLLRPAGTVHGPECPGASDPPPRVFLLPSPLC